MSAVAQKYQNLSVNELFEFIVKNPNKNHNLTPIEIVPPKEEDKETSTLEVLNLERHTATPMNPSSVLGIFHWISDPLYGLALPNVRSAMLREFATALQLKTETLQGTSLARKRRKLHDWVSVIAGGGTIKEDEWIEFYSAMATMQEVQLVLVRRQTTEEGEEVVGSGFKGEISFATNPINWSNTKPVWIADYRGRWLATPLDDASNPVGSEVSIWLGSLETSGWVIEWPDAEGTKESIVEELKSHITWKDGDNKLKKDILSKRLGKLKTFTSLRTT
jgi:hypothetical protein